MRQTERREFDKMCEAHKLCLGICARPLRQGSHATAARLGQRGWLPERVPATALARFPPPRSASTRLTLAGEARRRTRSPFSLLPALISAATGAAQDSLEARGSLSGREAVLLEEQLLLARTLREWVLEEGRARVREEERPQTA